MKNLFKQNAVFLTLSLMLAVALGLALLCIPKGELHLLLCDRHTPARDIFYRYYTRVAEWFPYVICVALLLFSRIGDGVLATACMALSGLATQGLKYAADTDRPLKWFADNMPDVTLPLVEGVRMSKFYSFPSGHTTSFFALAFVLCILYTGYAGKSGYSGYSGNSGNSGKSGKSSNLKQRTFSNLVQMGLFFLAALGGYSRIYLSQHFTSDVAGGIVVGILISMLCYVFFSRYNGQKWYNYRLFAKK